VKSKVRRLIAALVMSVSASASLAEPNSNSTCAAAHSTAIADLYACTDSASGSPEVKTAMTDWSQCLGAMSSYGDDAAHKECRGLGSVYANVLQAAQFACVTVYDKKDADIRQSCGEASRATWCATRIAIASLHKNQSADWNPPRICTATKDSPMPITAVGRESLNRPPGPPCNDPAVTACWSHCSKDDAVCFQNCSNIAASVCGPSLQTSNSNLQSRKKPDLSRQNDAVPKRQGTYSPGVKAGPTSGAGEVKSKNNLDRFDGLGPGYVSQNANSTTVRGTSGTTRASSGSQSTFQTFSPGVQDSRSPR